MELQEKYDELEDIADTIDSLVERIEYNTDFIDELRETLYRAINEKQEIEPRLQREQWQEEMAMNYEYERSAI